MKTLLLAGVLALCACAAGPRAGVGGLADQRAALSAGDPAARAAAAFSLGQLGMSEAPDGTSESPQGASWREAAIASLVPAAADADPAVRRASVEALGKVGGPESDDALLSAVTDVDAGVRGEAAMALFRRRLMKRVPEYSTAAVRALETLSADADPEVRWRAVYAFTRFADARARKVVSDAQRDADARVRLFAARALAKLGEQADAALLLDADPYVRAEAVASYGAAKGGQSLPAALSADPSAHVRAAVADAIAATGRPDLASGLERMADADGPLARGRALLALAALRGDAEASRLERARQDADWWIRSKAYEASAGLTGGDAVLRAGLKDPDARVASAALEALASTKSTLVEDALAEVLRDPRAPLELLGAAVDAAGTRKSAALLEPLLEAGRRLTAAVPAEIRGGLRAALEEVGAANPDKKERAAAGLRSLPALVDQPKTFPRLSASPTLVLETLKGKVELFLDAAAAPNHAAAIAAMARSGLYDGTIWHRVVTAFVVQGGDPRGSGWGDAGYRLRDEVNRLPFLRGTLGMPKAGPDTGGCQLFVSLVPTPHLDGRYTAFGRVTAGMDVLDALEPGDRILKAYLR